MSPISRKPNKRNKPPAMRMGEKTFLVLLKSAVLLTVFHMLINSSISLGVAAENSFRWRSFAALATMNHRMLAWTGLILLLIAFPLSKIVLFWALKTNSLEFYFWQNKWTKTAIGFLTGLLISTMLVAVPLLTGCAFLIGLPNRLIPQEIVASALTYSILMLLVAFYVELIYRGVMMCELTAIWRNRFMGITATSLVYGILNAWYFYGNPTDKMIVFISGVIFSWCMAGVMIYTRSINIVIGIHAGWFYGLHGLMGCSVGQHTYNLTLFVTQCQSPRFLLGTQSGFQFSLISNIVWLVLSAIVWFRINAQEKNNTAIRRSIDSDVC